MAMDRQTARPAVGSKWGAETLGPTTYRVPCASAPSLQFFCRPQSSLELLPQEKAACHLGGPGPLLFCAAG